MRFWEKGVLKGFLRSFFDVLGLSFFIYVVRKFGFVWVCGYFLEGVVVFC